MAFCCASAKLVIELDGSLHYESQGIAHDMERAAFFESLGLKVLRFSNRDADWEFLGVCEPIHLAVQKRANASLSHLR